jgi:2-C-methyl-D-erythritol 2,4-cyclodiphosphate synthase
VIVRVGQGYDLHRLAEGRKLFLAGVEVASEVGSAGHSDADVVLHAVIDALLGAAGLGDIGEHFPDTDPAFAGIDSGLLLTQVLDKVWQGGFTPVNVDVTIIAEKPKLKEYKPAMRQRLSKMLNLAEEAVSIKAKTNEGIGEIGKGEAIACMAVVGLALKN